MGNHDGIARLIRDVAANGWTTHAACSVLGGVSMTILVMSLALWFIDRAANEDIY